MRPSLALILILGGCGAAPAVPAQTLRSGLYEQLTLAVAPDGKVTGHYREDQGEGVVKSCSFDVTGKLDGANKAAIATRTGNLRGRIVADADGGVTLTLPQGRSLPGCGAVLLPEIDAGVSLDRVANGSWTSLATVTVPRAAVKAQPGGPAGRAYVVRGDVLGITGRQGAQVRIVYPSERAHPTAGWVDASALTPIAP